MTTSTTGQVGHLSEEVTAMEIDGFRGQLITADHTDYDTARAVWNGAVDRRPRLIARCSGTADVAAAVRFARDHDLAPIDSAARATGSATRFSMWEIRRTPTSLSACK